MTSLTSPHYAAIKQVLEDYADFLGQDEHVQLELVLDCDRNRYLLIETGWDNGHRVYGSLLHIDIIDDQLWIQQDNTEDGIVEDLVAAGIPPERIVQAFKVPVQRSQIEFAVL